MASKLRGAVSRDRAAAADTWYKWDGAAFSRRGLGEEGERFRDTSNRPLPSGEHPSIHWNRSPYCTLLYCAPLHTLEQVTVLYCTVLYCTVLYCTAHPSIHWNRSLYCGVSRL